MRYEQHPLGRLFPRPSAQDRKALRDSLKQHGFRPEDPIFLYQGKTLDGLSRSEIASELGIEPVYREFTGTEEEALRFCIARNVARRHLTAGAKAALSTLIVALFFFGGVQLMFLGIIGEYVSSIHSQVRKRPLVVERELLNLQDSPR